MVIFWESPFVVVFEGRAKQGSGRMSGSVSMQIPEARVREQPKRFPIEYLAEGIGLKNLSIIYFYIFFCLEFLLVEGGEIRQDISTIR